MPVSEHTGSAYDFLAEENYPRWYRLLQPFLKGVRFRCSLIFIVRMTSETKYIYVWEATLYISIF